MSYTKVEYDSVEPVGGGLHFLRDALDCETVGVSVLEVDSGWAGKEHNHGEDGQEEVYLLLDGEATVTIDGEEVSMESGDALRIPAEATRQIYSDTESKFVLVGASEE